MLTTTNFQQMCFRNVVIQRNKRNNDISKRIDVVESNNSI